MTKKSKDIEAWMRHFDSQLWVVTSIMTASIAVLLIWVMDNKDKHHLNGVMIFGWLLSMATIYFYASFKDLYNTVDPKDIKILEGRTKVLSYQRQIYFCIFTVLSIIWAHLISNCSWFPRDIRRNYFFYIIAVVSVAIIIWFGYSTFKKEKKDTKFRLLIMTASIIITAMITIYLFNV